MCCFLSFIVSCCCSVRPKTKTYRYIVPVWIPQQLKPCSYRRHSDITDCIGKNHCHESSTTDIGVYQQERQPQSKATRRHPIAQLTQAINYSFSFYKRISKMVIPITSHVSSLQARQPDVQSSAATKETDCVVRVALFL